MKLALEIGTEAIPAGYLPPAVEFLKVRLTKALEESRLAAGPVEVFATPTRLVVTVGDLSPRQRDEERHVRGPRKSIAYTDGLPGAPAMGFAKKSGVPVEDLLVVDTENGEFLEARVHVAGKALESVLPELLQSAVRAIPWPKTMKWNEGGTLFPRPIRWVLALLDQQVLPIDLAGTLSGRETRGHRLHAPRKAVVAEAAGYLSALMDLGIMLDPAARYASIKEQLQEQAAILGGRPVGGEALLTEVTYLCEDPTVLTGSIDAAFLEMPREILVTAMRTHQRYFAVETPQGELLPHFLVVCDGRWNDASLVLLGNERVLRARLADARFYWDVDTKRGLDAMAAQLKDVVWLEAVGSMHDKMRRIEDLAAWLGERLFSDWEAIEPSTRRAARISKADLASEMIKDGKEFTGLQGLIASRYGQALGEPEEVCLALEEQYFPRGGSDHLPGSPVGILLAMADRMDTIAGCFLAGLIPTGSQDPYALRRAGNGMVRILMEQEHHLDLQAFAQQAVSLLPDAIRCRDVEEAIRTFLRERMAYYLSRDGAGHDVVEAVIVAGVLDPLDALARARAIEAVRGEPDLERLVIGFKRAANILRGVESQELPDPRDIDWADAEAAERELWHGARGVADLVGEALNQTNYPEMVSALLTLRAPIDTFFDDVMVMSEDQKERVRRLALLNFVRGLFAGLCDLSKVVLQGDRD